MKKIKLLLGIGFLSALFSTCFGAVDYTGTLSIFHSVNSTNQQLYGNSNGILYYSHGYGALKINTNNYFRVNSGTSVSSSSFWGGNVGNTLSGTFQYTGNSSIFPNYKFSFYTPNGFSLSGLFSSGQDLTVLDIFDFSNGNTFLGAHNLNYENGDIYPIIFDIITKEYLTFNNETTLVYYGGSHNFGNQGLLKYCFYGVDFDLSCVFYDEILGYHYVNFSLFNDGISISTGFLVIPLNTFYTGSLDNPSRSISSFTGDKTLVIAPGINSQGGTDIIYNIIDVYSSNISDLKNGNIISRGNFDINIDSFLTRSFLVLPGTTNTLLNGLGKFSEIFELNGNFYYRSNSLITKQHLSSSSSSQVGNCMYHIESCMPIGQLTLVSNSSVPDILDSIGNQSSFPDPIFDGGVFDANTFLIEEAIKCYITSGEVCNSPFTYDGSVTYVNNYDHQERIWNSDSKTGELTFNNAYDMLSQYCLNTSTIQYSFCSQLDLYMGYPITYFYNNGYFNYYVFGSGFTVNLGAMWSGQLGYAYCEGPFCSNFNQGLPQYIRKDTGDYSAYGFSGEYVSLDFFKNYFDNGFFFQCPFSYSGSYFTIGGKLINRLDSHDPLKPINCFIAAFSHGVKSSFFGDASLGLSHSGTFMQNTGPNAKRFYTFFDILLSLGYVMFFSKFFKFLKKH